MPKQTRMPENLAKLHDLIGRELYLLYTKWDFYKKLFCKSNKTVQLLHDTAELFFVIYREMLRDDIILTICKITDRATTNIYKQTRDNLTLKQLIKQVPHQQDTVSFIKILEDLANKIDEKCGPLRSHRNRRIGHYDLQTRLKQEDSLIPNISLAEGNQLLTAICNLMNVVEKHYDNHEQTYKHGIMGSGNAKDLIEFFDRNIDLEKYFNKKEFGDII